MPPRLARTARSSSRSSKRGEPAPSPNGAVVAVGEIVGAHALRGWLRVRAYQPPAPSLVPGRRVLIEHAGACRELEVVSATPHGRDRKSTRLNSSHRTISYAVFCLKKKK